MKKIVFMIALLVTVVAVSQGKAEAALSKTQCEKQLRTVNYRSAALAVYQASENKKYQAVRSKWSERVSYAGLWVPKDAEKARESIYRYDVLRTKTNRELNKQVERYKSLQNKPLDCSVANLANVEKHLAEIKGNANKKQPKGSALIGQLKQTETNYAKGDFKKDMEKVVKKMHDRKKKQPKPEFEKLYIKPYQPN